MTLKKLQLDAIHCQRKWCTLLIKSVASHIEEQDLEREMNRKGDPQKKNDVTWGFVNGSPVGRCKRNMTWREKDRLWKWSPLRSVYANVKCVNLHLYGSRQMRIATGCWMCWLLTMTWSSGSGSSWKWCVSKGGWRLVVIFTLKTRYAGKIGSNPLMELVRMYGRTSTQFNTSLFRFLLPCNFL